MQEIDKIDGCLALQSIMVPDYISEYCGNDVLATEAVFNALKRAAKKHNSFSYAFLGASVIGVVLSLLSLETSFLFIIPALVCLAGVLSWEYANGEFGNYQSKKENVK